MEHHEFRHKLSEYIDGSITSEEKNAMEEHLKTCASCSDALRELRKTIEHIKTVEEVEAPAWMTQKIMAEVRSEDAERKGWFRKLFFPLSVKVPIQAVAVLFLAIGAFYIYRSIQPSYEPAEAPVKVFEAKKEAPSVPAESREERSLRRRSQPSEQVPQTPGYKALDMKQEYEKPAPPAMADKMAPAPAPEMMVEQPRLAKKESAPRKSTASPQARAMIHEEQAAPEKTRLLPGKDAVGGASSMDKSELSRSEGASIILRTAEDVDIVKSCKILPAVSGDSFIIHGRLSLSYGTPSMRIWKIDSERLFGVYDMAEELYSRSTFANTPGTIEKNLNFSIEVYGDFLVYSLTPEKDGVMQHVCVESASNLISRQK